jgi:general secretion pathway protein G
MKSHSRPMTAGFTLIELVVTLALLGLMAGMAYPLTELTQVRQKETALKQALREIRTALDAYKAATDAGQIAKAPGSSGFPESLEDLVSGVVNQKAPNGAKLQFMRRIPRDPFATDPALQPSQTWLLRSYSSSAEDPQPGADVFDVVSRSTRIGLNGIAYRQW